MKFDKFMQYYNRKLLSFLSGGLDVDLDKF